MGQHQRRDAMKSPVKPGGFDWSKPRRFSQIAFILCVIPISQFCDRVIGGYLFLVHRYGFARVRAERLEMVKMPKSGPWLVSNGDVVPGGGIVWWFCVTFISLVLIGLVYLGVFRLLPVEKRK
jgi:hypothetical protein